LSRPVNVKSIEVIEDFTAALKKYQEEAAAALTDLQLEVQRAIDWIHHDRRAYWNQQVRRGWDRVGQAKADLEQARTFRRVAEHQPACREEKKALDETKRRLQLAEEKLEAVRHWSRAVDRAVIDYRGNLGPLARWLEIDLPQLLATLDRLSRSLQSYLAAEAPAEAPEAQPGRLPDEEPGEQTSEELSADKETSPAEPDEEAAR